MSTILVILAALLVFGSVIFVHELGHFITAKRCGIKVNEFAMGMGPRILKFTPKKSETTYSLRLLPIGGFVSMEGEDEESVDERSFQRASIPKRLLVILAGAFMNFVLGFVVLAILTATMTNADGTSSLIATRTIANVRSETTGLQAGDTIIKINGRRCFIINDISYEFARTQNGTFDLTVRRDGQTVQLDSVAFDVVTATDDDGEVVIDDATGEPYQYLDAGFSVLGVEKGFIPVVQDAFYTSLSYSRLILLTFGDLILGRTAVNQLSGPVGIVSEISKAVSISWRYVFSILALIAINLGVVNLLPFPALDGGKAVLLVIEAIRRKPLKQKYEIALNLAGFALLMLLMVFVSFNDIVRLFG